MFPRWLNEVIPGQLERLLDVQEKQETETGIRRREWQRTGPAKETVRSVCEGCNKGWMSRLEDCAKPVLSPLIRGESAALKGVELVLVAAWATKTATVIESRNPPEQCVSTPETRATVMNEQRPPASIQVYAFTFEGEPLSGYWRHAAAVVQRSAWHPADVANYAVTVMTFGHLGLRVVDDRAGLHAPLSGIKAPKIPGVVTIYPSLSALNWPLVPVLKETDLKAVRMASMSIISYWVGPVGSDDEGSG
jgi:hypothetical protein